MLAKDRVGFCEFGELLVCLLAPLVSVRVVLHGQLVIPILDLLLCGVWGDADDGVQVLGGFVGVRVRMPVTSGVKSGRRGWTEVIMNENCRTILPRETVSFCASLQYTLRSSGS